MLRHAVENDKNKIIQFYDCAIEANQISKYNIRWQKNVHPSHALLWDSILNHELYVYEDDNEIVGACVMNHLYNPAYKNVPWGIEGMDEEIGIIHVFAVSPKHFRKGIGRKMLQSLIAYASKQQLKAIRLDVFKTNAPAIALYQNVGFTFRKGMNMTVPNIGEEQFEFYEYIL